MPATTVTGIAATCHQAGDPPTAVIPSVATDSPNDTTAIAPATTAVPERGRRIQPRRRSSAAATGANPRKCSPTSLPGVSSATRSRGRGCAPNTALRTAARRGVAPSLSTYSRASRVSAAGASTMRRCPATAVSSTAAGMAAPLLRTRWAPSTTSTSSGGVYSGMITPRPGASRLRRRARTATPMPIALSPTVPSDTADRVGAASTENCSPGVRTTSPGTNVPRANPTATVTFSPGPRSVAPAVNVTGPSTSLLRVMSQGSSDPCSPR
ncbi:hypothetical protein SRABI128_02280 [Microbacterium sp. Bi128]|nr:hypothetical protein SRABI128_02280 [Microbacterium sp. Bi128]